MKLYIDGQATDVAGLSYTIPARALASGTHHFSAIVKDAAGNASTASPTASAVIDSTAPEITVVGGPGERPDRPDQSPRFHFLRSRSAGTALRCGPSTARATSTRHPPRGRGRS
jgi:hypothetical protein